MPYLRGSASRAKEQRVNEEDVSVNRFDPARCGLDVIAHSSWALVASDTAEVGSTDYTIIATAHNAWPGDLIELTSGTYSGRALTVVATTTDIITLAQTLPADLGAGITFDVLRIKPQRVGSSGGTLFVQAPASATQANSTVSTAKTIAAANTSRKGGYIQAAWSNTDNIYLSLNSPATSADIPLAPGGVFNMTLNFGGAPISNAIYGIAGSGSQAYCVVEA